MCCYSSLPLQGTPPVCDCLCVFMIQLDKSFFLVSFPTEKCPALCDHWGVLGRRPGGPAVRLLPAQPHAPIFLRRGERMRRRRRRRRTASLRPGHFVRHFWLSKTNGRETMYQMWRHDAERGGEWRDWRLLKKTIDEKIAVKFFFPILFSSPQSFSTGVSLTQNTHRTGSPSSLASRTRPSVMNQTRGKETGW